MATRGQIAKGGRCGSSSQCNIAGLQRRFC